MSQALFPHWWQFLLVDVPFICGFRVEANRVVCYAHPDAPLIEDYRAGDMICSECGLVVGDRYQKNNRFCNIYETEICQTELSRAVATCNHQRSFRTHDVSDFYTSRSIN